MAEALHNCKDTAAWLASRASVLLLTHERPDGDALGSIYGLHLTLRAGGKECDLYHEAPVPERYRRILPAVDGVYLGSNLPAKAYDGVVCLDTTNVERVGLPPGLVPAAFAPEVCCVDHHPDHVPFGDVVWVEPGAAATAQMLTRLIRDAGMTLPAPAATCFLVGLIMDTGALRFPNTNAEVLREAACLIEAGAAYTEVMTALFMHVPYNRLVLEAQLVANTAFAHSRRLAYAVLTDDMLTDLGLDPGYTEGLIDVLRTIDGVEIAGLLQPQDGGVRFSLRSGKPTLPVDGIARELGGGGHHLAAGAFARTLTLRDAENRLLELTRKVLENG